METNQQHKIETSQEFAVPVEMLFKAWTEQEHLQKWWRPMGETLESVKSELEEGGANEYYFESKAFKITGNYQQADVNKKLVYTWNWDFEGNELENEKYILHIKFESTDGGSKLLVVQEGLASEEVLPAHEDGWKTGLESLKSYLEVSSDGSSSENKSSSVNESDSVKSDEGMNDRSGGYNELPEQAKVGGG
ncbi:SRPBCC family protein [Dyadobacter psychrotolerans]|uniref:SRPBCC domain-containing protein n=1 Tax=Dyadobacter psychrotolerans TaxID=2541721 RepID=A0A4R5DUA0_9BACT|nr:SRPBCC domain-containing protein [Dyadobacter psychrotolerans]TDE14503.1 SRPBCC domain-containing protein [Dyadobacter psychrotolerans]